MTNSQESIQGYKKGFKAFIFDLDGTLLNTLPDLVVVANKALQNQGFPERTTEEILSFVGAGGLALMRRAVPEGTSEECINQAFEDFQSLYSEYGTILTKEYTDMSTILSQLKAQGKKIGVLSNKFDAGVQECVEKYFPGLVDVAHGESETVPRKPDPTGLLLVMKELGVESSECVYFGDSPGDMTVAHKGEAYPVGCLWGYRTGQRLKEAGAEVLIEDTYQILSFA